MFFFDANEYGWGYRLFADGEEQAARILQGLATGIAECSAGMSEAEVAMFRQFEVTDDEVDVLKRTLGAGVQRDTEEEQPRRDAFRSVLGIDEFTRMSYSYLYNEHSED